MLKLLLVSPNKTSLSGLASVLMEQDDVAFSWAESGEKAIDIASGAPFDLVVTDETLGDMSGLTFAERLLALNPMINCAVVSHLPTDEFHEVSEGLGLMGQLPLQPDKEDTITLLNHLRNVKALLGETTGA
jgi:DNA-binding response OmpR family regulator